MGTHGGEIMIESLQIPKFHYDKKHDILYIVIKDGEEEEFLEIAEGISLELDSEGEIIGIEIFNASKLIKMITPEEG